MDSSDIHKVENLHNHDMDDMDHNSYQRWIRPYSSRHSRRLISQHVQSLENHFGDNSSIAYDVNEIDSIPTVAESME
jgi:thiaminase